jgi:NhaA family Na+:H+ antiporter
VSLYGVSVLCGIGFTMSLFISSLAAEKFGTGMMVNNRLGILCGSVLSAILGYLVLAWTLGHANGTCASPPHTGTLE